MISSSDGKSARACDNCVKKRARWYCAADDAFLCQSCDSSVHSANPLARRHERVRLNVAGAAASKSQDSESRPENIPGRDLLPWHHRGFTRKPRTPRPLPRKGARLCSLPLRLVPEVSGEEEESEEEQLLYRVPIFEDPVVCSTSNEGLINGVHGMKPVSCGFDHHEPGFVPPEIDLAEFAADVESLLGTGLDDESFDMEGLGILDYDVDERVKVEEIGEAHEFMDLNFDYDSPITFEEEAKTMKCEDSEKVVSDGKKIFLKLDYENVMSAWDDHKSPWMAGKRPDFDECWPHCMGTCGTVHVYGEMRTMGGHLAAATVDGGREARVSRYREKRRTRLFSKKIRYEVRKLNAEKRPRMKGRFVKRANLVQFAHE